MKGARMPSEADLADALQHANITDEDWNVSDFDVKALGDISFSKLERLLDEGMDWLDVRPEDSDEDRLLELRSFRGDKWAERAEKWLESGVPPIVIITTPDCNSGSCDMSKKFTQLGDGRGRVNFMVAHGLKKIPAVQMVFRSLRKNPSTGAGASYAKEVFAQLVERAPSDAFLEPVRLVVDDATALQGRKGLDEGGRGCACASDGTVFVSRALLEGPATRIQGVLAHELAHVHLLQHGDENHSEREADAVARKLFKVDIGYDEADVQTSGPGQRPRPARLDRRRNPGHAHEGCVVSNPARTSQPITTTKQHEGVGSITWEYIGTVDAADTRAGVGVHPRKVFTLWYYGVPRESTPGFGVTAWDVWIPRGKPGYSDAKIAKWQAACPHVFHDDALDLLVRWEASVVSNPERGASGSGPMKSFRAPTQREIVEVLRAHPLVKLKEKVRRAFLIGSFAKGKQHSESDVDILLEVAPKAGYTADELTAKYRRALQQYFVTHDIKGKADDVHPQWMGRRVDVYFTYDANAADPERRPKIPLARSNPSATAALSELAEQDAGDFGEFYSDDPEELRQSGEVRHGRKVVWVGSPGKMVEIDRHFVSPIQGNQFDPQKLAAVAEAVRDQSAPTESGKPVLYVGYGTVQFVTQSDIDEAGQYEDDEWPLDRDLDESDIGRLFYTIRDGNHRTFGALIGGETKVWMNLDANQLQDVEAWRRRKKEPLPEYLAKNRSHLKLMKLLDEKLRAD